MTIPIDWAKPMDADEYQNLAARTALRDPVERTKVADRLLENLELVNYALGAAGEAGELADHLKKHIFHGHPLDRMHLLKEVGDQAWYLANTARVIGASFGASLRCNIFKLMKRFPNGFTEQDSINRADVGKS